MDLQPTSSGKTPFADIRNKTPSYPLIKASLLSTKFRDHLTHAWKQEQCPEDLIYELGQEAIKTGAANHTRNLINEKIDLAIEHLGSYVHRPGCREIALWARGICKNLIQEKAV